MAAGKLANMAAKNKNKPKATTAAVEATEAVETKSGPAPKGRDKKLSIYTTAAKKKALMLQKIEEDRTVNDIVNDAIDLYLKTKGGPQKS